MSQHCQSGSKYDISQSAPVAALYELLQIPQIYQSVSPQAPPAITLCREKIQSELSSSAAHL